MASFTGTECLVCKNKFKDDDDVVVCPECGTPYHRECYASEGRCVNDILHAENKSWSEQRKEEGTDEQKSCSRCGAVNKPHSLICESCGESLVDNLNFSNAKQQNGSTSGMQNPNFGTFTFNPEDKYCGINPDEEIAEDVKVSEAADFVGTNVPYYLMLFKRMKDTGKKLTLNIVCVLFPHFYFAYRKMWGAAVIVTLLISVLSLPQIIYSMSVMAGSFVDLGFAVDFIKSIDVKSPSMEFALMFANYALMAVRILTFLFANWVYYRHMEKKIKYIKNQNASPEMVSKKIASSGGTSVLGVVLTIVLELVLSAIIFVGLMYL